MMVYEIWDLESGNAVADFETEAEALALVRRTVHDHGRGEATPWALLAVDDTDAITPVADGDALIARALGAAATA